jgi:hypothetical protein
MVKHMIIWKLKPMSEEALAEQMKLVKENLEGLAGKIPGMTHVHVQIDNLPTSNGDMMLDSTFESPEALKGYSVHPEHVHVAETYIRPYIETRLCIDYEV